MKALFLIFHGFEEANGISKKIRYQIEALKECGLQVEALTSIPTIDIEPHKFKGARSWLTVLL